MSTLQDLKASCQMSEVFTLMWRLGNLLLKYFLMARGLVPTRSWYALGFDGSLVMHKTKRKGYFLDFLGNFTGPVTLWPFHFLIKQIYVCVVVGMALTFHSWTWPSHTPVKEPSKRVALPKERGGDNHFTWWYIHRLYFKSCTYVMGWPHLAGHTVPTTSLSHSPSSARRWENVMKQLVGWDNAGEIAHQLP